jgi:hypothetical protein
VALVDSGKWAKEDEKSYEYVLTVEIWTEALAGA